MMKIQPFPQRPSWKDNSATHNEEMITVKCKHIDEQGSEVPGCGNTFSTHVINGMAECPECRAEMHRAFWATMEE